MWVKQPVRYATRLENWKHKSKKDYPDKLRRIKFFDNEHNQNFVFIINNAVLQASEIALLYMKTLGSRIIFQMDETASQN